MPLTEQDYQQAATALGCDIRAIMAVDKVESGGNGFLPTGELKILFEAHIFWQELQAKGIKPILSDICYPKWGTKPYGKSSEQWGKLNAAAAIDKEAAYKSASWGRYQPLGRYFAQMDYSSVLDMVNDFKTGEPAHLEGFVEMIKFRKLADELQRQDWATFALHYNGSGYKANRYDEKLKAAFDSF